MRYVQFLGVQLYPIQKKEDKSSSTTLPTSTTSSTMVATTTGFLASSSTATATRAMSIIGDENSIIIKPYEKMDSKFFNSFLKENRKCTSVVNRHRRKIALVRTFRKLEEALNKIENEGENGCLLKKAIYDFIQEEPELMMLAQYLNKASTATSSSSNTM